ncbi:MAG TPA: glycosyltransferase, partial [Tepidiformaceae bacterium]|nr:glycosyltransferase [Tepidiformaceae bacterium]
PGAPADDWGFDFDGATPPGFRIYTPEAWLPEVFRPPAVARWMRRERLRRARRLLQRQGCRKTILYLWRPEYARALDLVEHDLSCYHIDDEYTFSPVEQPLSTLEAALIQRVDQVFIHSQGLLDKKGHLNPHTRYVPNGVDYRSYSTPHPEPDDLAKIARPRIGYVGLIKPQLDLGLIEVLAGRHPTWSFVLVGPPPDKEPLVTRVRTLGAMPNVHLLGPKPVSALPAYAQHLDVCLLCYAMDDYTKYIYPMKLHEYLATGRPVVGAPIRSLQAFDDVVTLARTPAEWSAAIAAALDPEARSPSRVAARRAVAQEHDWERIVREISGTMAERLGASYWERLERARPAGSPSIAFRQ